MSFLVIGGYWLQHHRLFRMLGRGNGWLLLLNLLFLLTISFLPFPTAVMADRLVSGHQVNLAVAFYGVGLLLPAITVSVLLNYIDAAALLAPSAQNRATHRLARLSWLSVVLFTITIGVALIAPLIALLYYFLSPIYWAINGARASHELEDNLAA